MVICTQEKESAALAQRLPRNVAALSKYEKIGEAMRRSVPLLPAGIGQELKSLLSGLSLAIMLPR